MPIVFTSGIQKRIGRSAWKFDAQICGYHYNCATQGVHDRKCQRVVDARRWKNHKNHNRHHECVGNVQCHLQMRGCVQARRAAKKRTSVHHRLIENVDVRRVPVPRRKCHKSGFERRVVQCSAIGRSKIQCSKNCFVCNDTARRMLGQFARTVAKGLFRKQLQFRWRKKRHPSSFIHGKTIIDFALHPLSKTDRTMPSAGRTAVDDTRICADSNV